MWEQEFVWVVTRIFQATFFDLHLISPRFVIFIEISIHLNFQMKAFHSFEVLAIDKVNLNPSILLRLLINQFAREKTRKNSFVKMHLN